MHPANLLEPEDLAVLGLWLACRGNGMAPGPLPFAGGAAEQPAWLMAAFQAMDAAAALLRLHDPDQDDDVGTVRKLGRGAEEDR